MLRTSDPISVGAAIPTAEANYVPSPNANETGYVFDGWYADAACTSTKYNFTTMPIDGITVYAKWVQIQYRVFFRPNVPEVDDQPGDVSWGAPGETTTMNFRVNYKGTVSTPTGILDGYEFGGWYTDDGTFQNYYNGEFELLTDDNTIPYDKTDSYNWTDGKDGSPMDKWGNVSNPGYNSDSETKEGNPVDRHWITRKLDLFAKWKALTIGAKGINVKYDATEEGTDAPLDSAFYEDNSRAYAQAASKPLDQTQYMFDCWHVMKYDYATDSYSDTGVTVLPGDDFTVLKANAKITDEDGNPVDPKAVTTGNTYVYTVLLQASYKPVLQPTPTYIDWYQNDKDPSELLHKDENVAINDGVKIYTLLDGESIPERAGYKFLGWAREEETEDGENLTTYYPGLTVDDLYLMYVEDSDPKDEVDDSCYKAKNESGQWVPVTEVAADEYKPYQAFYAVWEDEYFYVFHSSDCSVEKISFGDKRLTPVTNDNNVVTGFTFNIAYETKAGNIYGGYYKTYPGVTDDAVKQLTYAEKAPGDFTYGRAAATTNLWAAGPGSAYDGTVKDFWTGSDAYTVNGLAMTPEVNGVYYLKEVPDVYLTAAVYVVYDTVDTMTVNENEFNAVRKLFMMSCTDDANYNGVGFDVNVSGAPVPSGTSAMAESITIQKNGSTYETITAGSMLSGKEGRVFMRGATSLIVKDARYREIPYHITKDNVKVTSIRQLTVFIRNTYINLDPGWIQPGMTKLTLKNKAAAEESKVEP